MRAPSAVDQIADGYLEKLAALDPLLATAIGVPGHDHEVTDLSPAGWQARADAARAALAEVVAAEPVDDIDRVTTAAMRERLGAELALHDAGEHIQLNNIASPVQRLRDVFDLMPVQTQTDWEHIAARMQALPAATAGLIESLRVAAAQGRVSPRRQVAECLDQSRELAADGFFTELAEQGLRAHPGLAEPLHAGAGAARRAYQELADHLSDLLSQAPEADACGRERYALWSRYFLGAQIDLEESYAWGLDEVARIASEQAELAQRIAGPGATVPEAIALLDADPARQLHGTTALQEWMQQTTDTAVAALADSYFEIPDPIRRLECRIAPTARGGIYYTGPSEDLSRPGRMWWSVPPEQETFTTWQEKTTVYHEGVPGHHLQIARAVHAPLNRWRRLVCATSGHEEGWALYAEQLMADFGFLDEAERFGLLDSQRLRATRVVVDLGVHLRLRNPDGGTWDAAAAWDYLRRNVAMAEPFLRFEWVRYLGWPGQAASYAVGRRLWETARTEAVRRMPLRDFHDRALSLGSLGLDVLRAELARI